MELKIEKSINPNYNGGGGWVILSKKKGKGGRSKRGMVFIFLKFNNSHTKNKFEINVLNVLICLNLLSSN